jgi:hypothetical protein
MYLCIHAGEHTGPREFTKVKTETGFVFVSSVSIAFSYYVWGDVRITDCWQSVILTVFHTTNRDEDAETFHDCPPGKSTGTRKDTVLSIWLLVGAGSHDGLANRWTPLPGNAQWSPA